METSDEPPMSRQDGSGMVSSAANLHRKQVRVTHTTAEDKSSLPMQSMVTRSELRSEVVNLHVKPSD